MHQLRLLSVDDLMILRGLHEGLSVTSIGHKLGLSQPAITQRIRKMEDAFSVKLLEKEGRGVKLSAEGKVVAQKAISALAILETAPGKVDPSPPVTTAEPAEKSSHGAPIL
jgi:DNA-binding transcriptional LysR family regulator